MKFLLVGRGKPRSNLGSGGLALRGRLGLDELGQLRSGSGEQTGQPLLDATLSFLAAGADLPGSSDLFASRFWEEQVRWWTEVYDVVFSDHTFVGKFCKTDIWRAVRNKCGNGQGKAVPAAQPERRAGLLPAVTW